jgi:acetyltransferase-like isoleucine patch superfamily enzyme
MDIYVNQILQRYWRNQGIDLGDGIIWYGKPILTKSKDSSISIGDHCRICSDSSQTALGVNHPVILRTLHPGSKLVIGSGVRMTGTTICAAESVIIGDRCVIGANVTIVDTDFHSMDPVIRSSKDDDKFACHKAISIGNDVFIGGNSIILKGVEIGDRVIIGAGSIVSRSIPDNIVVAGNPARPIAKVPINFTDQSPEFQEIRK